MTLLDTLWELNKDDLLIDKDVFIERLDGWNVVDFEKFIRINKGAEFHFTPKPGRKAMRSDIRQCVQPLIDEYGYALTSTPEHDTRQQKFNLMIGFDVVSRSNGMVNFRIERITHV